MFRLLLGVSAGNAGMCHSDALLCITQRVKRFGQGRHRELGLSAELHVLELVRLDQSSICVPARSQDR